MHEVPKDPVTSGNAEAGVFAYAQACAAASSSVSETAACEEAAPNHVSAVPDLGDDERVYVRRPRFVLDGKPVLLATSYLPMSLVAGSAITQEDAGT